MLTNSRDIIRRLEREGWRLVRVKGSHHQFKNPATGRRVTVPHPRKDITVGTVHSIYHDAGWAKD
ncbi:MAG: type II toxin-antitoxin system HicA family toxin [Beijerinckiaceae bacterium]